MKRSRLFEAIVVAGAALVGCDEPVEPPAEAVQEPSAVTPEPAAPAEEAPEVAPIKDTPAEDASTEEAKKKDGETTEEPVEPFPLIF